MTREVDIKKLLVESANEANRILVEAAGKLARNGLCHVHVVCAGYTEELCVELSSGAPIFEQGDKSIYPVVARERACLQAKHSRPTNFVPAEYSLKYPDDHDGSAQHHNICVGVASDNARRDGVIAELYAVLVYDELHKRMKDVGLLE